MKKSEFIVSEKHIAFLSTNDVDIICKPLFEHTPIDFLLYVRYYRNNSVITLSNCINAIQYFLGERADLFADWETSNKVISSAKNTLYNKNKQICWFVKDTVPETDFNGFVEKLNIMSGIQLCTKSKDYIELFWFDSQQKKIITDFYLYHFDILEKFLLYFRMRAGPLIKQHESNKIIVPNWNKKVKDHFESFARNIYIGEEKIDILNNQLNLKKYPLIYDSKETYITVKELKCLQLLAEGNTYKSIGRDMHISFRTVEQHVQNVKNRLGIFTKHKLLEFFRSSALLDIP